MLDNKTSFQELYDPFDFMVLGFFPRQPSLVLKLCVF